MEVLLHGFRSENIDDWKSKITLAECEPIESTSSDSANCCAALISVEPTNAKDLFESIQNDSRFSGCRIIAVTDHTDLESLYALGFDDCIDANCDITQLKTKLTQAAEVAKMEARLAQAQKLESIGELAAGIAHEINTPIQYVGDNTRFVQAACNDLVTVLDECCQLLKAAETGSDLPSAIDSLRTALNEADVDYLMDEIPSAIGQSLEGVDRVANIVRAMKDFAHPGASEMTAVDLQKSIENTVMVARNEWKYVADLETQFDTSLTAVQCLPGELNQVLLNLIVNASHAIGTRLGESPTGKGTIRISTSRQEDMAEIRIEDSGTGIDQKHINNIFKPFFTTKAQGKGTGQGLAIAHSVIVEKHGGTLDVESTLGEGTTFIIRIPMNAASEDQVLVSDQC